MIPALSDNGLLPPGIHGADWAEFSERFGTTAKRRMLLGGLKRLIAALGVAGCKALYVDGSFVTAQERPNDYDACWDVEDVKIERIDPVLLNFSTPGKQAMARKYRGDIRLASGSPVETILRYLEFFQIDRDGNAKGIVKLDPRKGCE